MRATHLMTYKTDDKNRSINSFIFAMNEHASIHIRIAAANTFECLGTSYYTYKIERFFFVFVVNTVFATSSQTTSLQGLRPIHFILFSENKMETHSTHPKWNCKFCLEFRYIV